jgi:hypothetical protein
MASATLYVDVECYSPLLDPDGLIINDPDGDPIEVLSGWVDITSDIRITMPVSYSTGNPNNDIEARVADEGVLRLAFDNSIGNSQGVAGLYSPDHVNADECFVQNQPIRIRLVSNAITYYQWRGSISTIEPSAGSMGERITYVEALDFMQYFYNTDFTNVNIQTDKRDDELLTTLLAQLPRQPEAIDFDTGNDQYTYAFHDETKGTSHIITVIQKMMMSGLGKMFVRGGTTYSETLTYINRQNILNPGTPVAALDNTMSGLSVIRDDSSLIKKVSVVTYPAQIDATDVVLWQLNTPLKVDPGTSKTFTMTLRDPNGRATKVAALSLVTPVADTDYKFSSVSGSGNNLNANISFSYSDGTNSFDVTVTNNASVVGYLWYFFPRGKGIYLYEPVPTSKLTGQAFGKTLNVNMPYQEDEVVGTSIASLYSDWYSVPRSNITSCKIIGNKSDALMEAALVVQPGDYVTIKEDQTGIDTGFIVNGIDKELIPISDGVLVNAIWYLTQAQIVTGFILDTSILDTDLLGV